MRGLGPTDIFVVCLVSLLVYGFTADVPARPSYEWVWVTGPLMDPGCLKPFGSAGVNTLPVNTVMYGNEEFLPETIAEEAKQI